MMTAAELPLSGKLHFAAVRAGGAGVKKAPGHAGHWLETSSFIPYTNNFSCEGLSFLLTQTKQTRHSSETMACQPAELALQFRVV